MKRLLTAPIDWPIGIHGIGAAAAVAWFQWIKGKLDASYAASNHPVDYATGQTQFSGTTVKEYYAVMSEAGTLDIYSRTQMIDFGFILGVIAMGWLLGTLVARLARNGSWARVFGYATACFALAGASFDAIENLISFVMLANPSDFANWIALPYSGFAVAKFLAVTLAMAAFAGSFLLLGVGRILRRPKIG